MAIFQKAYRNYTGELSSIYARPLVIFRYSLMSVLSSRLILAFLVCCLVPSFAVMCIIYLRYNLDMLMQFEIPIDELVKIDAYFFAQYMLGPQLFFVFVLIMFTGPTLVSPDLRNSALSLYLSRPISKTSYVVGKLLVLVVLCSVISWVPGTLLILFQAYMAEGAWFSSNYHLPFATIASSLVWILSLSMMALAISATVKWAPVARLSFFGIVFVGSALGGIIRLIVGGWQGSMLSLFDSLDAMIQAFYGVDTISNMPGFAAAIVFLIVITLSALILYRRIRGFEVVA